MLNAKFTSFLHLYALIARAPNTNKKTAIPTRGTAVSIMGKPNSQPA